MSDQLKTNTPAPSSAALSRTGVGRASKAVSHWFGSSSGLHATRSFLRRQIWVWPIIAAVVFAAAHWWVSGSIENAMLQQRANDLNSVVDASVTAVRTWMNEQEINVKLIADDPKLQPLVAELLAAGEGPGAERKLLQSKAQQALRDRLKPRLETCGYAGFVVVSRGGVIVAADLDAPVGKKLAGYRREIYDQANGGKTLVSNPFRSQILLTDAKGELRANLPTMFAVGPLRDEHLRPIAALGLRIRPDDTFTRILSASRFGHSGETYAFDRNGLLLSQSRFDDDLKQIGLLVDQPDSQSILTVEIRDPQVNMAQGERPKLRRGEQPLTRMAAEAVQGNDGHDAEGYRNYRGVPSVGAWRWLPDRDMGIATEVDAAEAFQPVNILRRAFRVLLVLLVLSAAGIFAAMVYIARQHRELQKAAIAAKHLGQYTLEEKLGAGGMGTVYKARHAMLRRPTAVKLLDVDKMSEMAIARFEREVQLTSGLTHPNTVAIFDYGRTPEGIFYYAMEYLDGMNLEDLVQRNGPLPEARAVYILRQICGALSEAHARELVHRDIKPANIFLTSRGGLHDFVKVLDFGLVKTLDGQDNAGLTNAQGVTGTPLYLSPEAVYHPDQVDVRTDVYAVGAVGYYLLTGTPVFTGESVVEICMKHVKSTPESPSARLGGPVSRELEELVLRCLAKSPDERPANAGELLRVLETCAVEGSWTADDAGKWWAARAAAVTVDQAPTLKKPSPEVTMMYQGETRGG
jgi:hypothetical protein